MGSSGWPSFTYEAIDTHDYAPKGELLTGEVDFAVAPEIADLPLPSVGRDTAEIVTEAYEALANLRKLNGAGGVMEGLLLRTEALESSRIEGERTNVRRLFVISAGAQEKPEAHMTYNNFTALKEALQYTSGRISAGTIMTDHSTLMKRERFAGKLRTKAPETDGKLGATHRGEQTGTQKCASCFEMDSRQPGIHMPADGRISRIQRSDSTTNHKHPS